MRIRSIVLLVLVLSTTSCSPAPEAVETTSTTTTTTSTTTTTEPTTTTVATTTTTLPEAPPGYVFIEIADEGLRLALPEAWVAVDLTQEDWENLLSEGLATFAGMSDLVGEEAQAIISQGGLLLAYDLDHADDAFVTNLNILSFELVPIDDPDLMIPILEAQLEQLGAVDPAFDLVDVPLGPAIRVSYGFAPETGFTHTVIQYYVFGPEGVFIVTFSTGNVIELEIVFETIMATFDAIG